MPSALPRASLNTAVQSCNPRPLPLRRSQQLIGSQSASRSTVLDVPTPHMGCVLLQMKNSNDHHVEHCLTGVDSSSSPHCACLSPRSSAGCFRRCLCRLTVCNSTSKPTGRSFGEVVFVTVIGQSSISKPFDDKREQFASAIHISYVQAPQISGSTICAANETSGGAAGITLMTRLQTK